MTDTAPLLARDDANLVWIDLEMTGLVPERDRIIEIAVVVTDPQLTVRVEGPVFAIHQSDAVLAGMDAWNTATHGRSGLTDRVRASTVDEAEAERLGQAPHLLAREHDVVLGAQRQDVSRRGRQSTLPIPRRWRGAAACPARRRAPCPRRPG